MTKMDRASIQKIRERALELLRYDPKTGKLFWRVSRGRAKAGSVAGYVHKSGYLKVMIDGKLYRAHRLIWLMVHGTWPDDQIDHIDGDRSNNRIENLREATQAENLQNTGLRSDNKSGFAGVSWHKRARKWRARIERGGKRRHLGHFETKEEAAAARAAAKAKHHTFHPNVVERDSYQREGA